MTRPDLELMRGAIDMHAHTSPALFPRLLDDAELARAAEDYGMRGFVLKDHDMLTTGRAHHVATMYPKVDPFGAIVLNRSVGGLNPHVAEAAIHYGAKIVWMPSNHSKWHAEYFDMPDYPQLGRMKKQLPGPGVTVFDEDGKLSPEALQILDLVGQADVCLATGHLSLPEIEALLDEASARGVSRFIVTHANWALSRLDLEVQKRLVAKGATLEYVASSCVSPIFHEQEPSELAAWITVFEGENLVLGSDLGQVAGPPQPEGLRMLLSALLREGVPFSYLENMTRVNPAMLLGVD